jgi:hypothetical protein
MATSRGQLAGIAAASLIVVEKTGAVLVSTVVV